MILTSLPDAKGVHPILTIGKRYDVRPFGVNGAIVRCDDDETDIIMLASRLSAPVTAWYRWTVDTARPLGYWEFNHLEDGFVQTVTHPTSQVPEHDKLWKGGKWFGARAHLEPSTAFPGSQKVVLDVMPPLNIHFEFEHSTREERQRDGTVKTIPRLRLKYKGEGLAIFEDGSEAELADRALAYIRTHGYLAEWVYQKYKTGEYVNWTEKLRVYP